MSTQYPDPPTYAVPFIEGPNGLEFNPVWLQWFYGLTAFITASGGGGGGAANHNSLAGLQGGTSGEYYHTTNTQHTELVGNKAAHIVYAGPASGGATTPAFRALVPGDIPTGAVVAFGLDGEEGEFGDRGVPGPAGPAGQSVMGPPGLDGENDSFESFGFGVTGVSVTGANGIGVSGSPITSSGTIGLSLGDITPTSVSTPSIITASGALGITPAAGSSLNVALSGTGDFAVNTNQLYVDTSAACIGVNVTSPITTIDGYRNANTTGGVRFKNNNTGTLAVTGTSLENDTGTSFSSKSQTFYGLTGTGYTNIAGWQNVGLIYNGSSVAGQVISSAKALGYIAFQVGGLGSSYERVRFAYNSNVGVGTDGTLTLGTNNRLQIAGITAASNSLGISAWSADALGSRIELGKSRGAAVGTNTIVQDGDVVGSLLGYGANGSTFTNLASIGMEVDGTPGATNDMPGRIVFKTTPNGSGTLTEAMRLSQDQTALFASSIKTGTPTSGTAAAWKLGSHQSTVGLTFVTTDYIELDVAGTAYKLALAA